MGGSSSKDQYYIAKQNVTVWLYQEEDRNLIKSAHIKKDYLVQVLEEDRKWWKVRCGTIEGFAAKYYFAPKKAMYEYQKTLWYFGIVERGDSEQLLGDTANPDGSFLVRHSPFYNKDVLTLKYYSYEEDNYQYKHYDVKVGGGQFWFKDAMKFRSLPTLIEYCMANEAEGVETKLTNICLIPNPHSDPEFGFYNKDHDSLRVPMSEITWDKSQSALGEGEFGKVFQARFRDNIDVAVKQLKIHEGVTGEKALEEFFKEISTMRGLNHPNLVQLFAYVINKNDGNLMIHEFMAQGDLKRKLQNYRENMNHLKSEDKLWDKVLSWSVQIVQGMKQLEKLGIVHKDLAARNVLLDKFGRAKVADFGMASMEDKSAEKRGKFPIKWTAPECFIDKVFSSKSDVWSFGILLYEMLVLGENPYHFNIPKVTKTEYKKRMNEEYSLFKITEKKTWVEDTLRCEVPENLAVFYVTEGEFEDLVRVMQSCWDINPEDRPNFKELASTLNWI